MRQDMTKESQLVLDKLTEYIRTVPQNTLDKIECTNDYYRFLDDAVDYLIENNNSVHAFNTIIKSVNYLNRLKSFNCIEEHDKIISDITKIYIGTTIANELRECFRKGLIK